MLTAMLSLGLPLDLSDGDRCLSLQAGLLGRSDRVRRVHVALRAGRIWQLGVSHGALFTAGNTLNTVPLRGTPAQL